MLKTMKRPLLGRFMNMCASAQEPLSIKIINEEVSKGLFKTGIHLLTGEDNF